MDKTRLSRAIKGAIAAAAVTSSFSTVSLAQDVQQEVEEIVVTGSRIQRATDANSATPISVFDAAQLEQSGQTTLEDFLQNIPSMTGGQLGSSVNNGSGGLATVSLRGLGSSRTLILMNGRRLSSSGGATGVVDLNTIPTSVIERVEILRDGASTIYGSDAIAGVINIITKKGFEGAELTFDYGASTHGDGDEYLAAMTIGTGNDKGHVMLNAQYTKREDIWQGDRRFSECPLREISGNVVCGGSSTTTPARFSPLSDTDQQLIVDPVTGNERPFNAATDAYNFATASYLTTPQEVASIYGYGTYELYDWKDVTDVNAFTELSFVNRRSDQLMAAEGTFWGPVVPVTNPYNPLDEPVSIGRRLEETGGRSFSQDLNTWRGVVGLEGEFCNEWTWDLSYNYSRWVDTQIDRGRGNTVRFENLLDPVACAADPECAAAVDATGVTAWNPFAAGTLTEEMQNYALVTNSPVERSSLRSFQANLVGDFGEWALTGEAPAWAIGYENRAERTEIVPDGAAEIGQIYFVNGDAWGGNYSVDEFYGEVRVPVLEGRPWAEILAFEASFRYSDYNTIGDDTTFGAVVEYAPLEELRFRGTYSEGFRAPGLDDLFLTPTVSAEQYADPCNEYGSGDNANVVANCMADGIAPGTTISSTQATGLFGGNPDLEAEKSESWTLGIVWTPSWTDDMGFTVDYFNINIDDAIGTLTTDTIVQGCYESPGFSSPLCDLITGAGAVGSIPSSSSPYRQTDNTIAGQLLNSQNVSTFETSGVDLGFDYSMDAGPGVVTVNLSATYLHEWKYQGSPEDPTIDLAGYYGADPVTTAIVAFPEWKFYGTLGYEYDCWSAFTTVRMLGEVDDIDPKPSDLVTHIDTTWYQDINFNYFRWENVTLTGGIRNMWNQQPPYVTNNDDMNTLMRSYDTVGRFFYGSVTLQF
ncbi:TonB-dependent receptor [Microbulbifer elongatus]|uniref:TonB-dependent receptor n=1 Tax=Microbulbifer elongatus TaxID=86173 RepID=A0ABT1NX00_9GAMM|nr:TonB-dependent receptor [Microbulbifer elongatus]MCQ3828416.1 TonB-dependent receptor [Microbulbifer elongatus]